MDFFRFALSEDDVVMTSEDALQRLSSTGEPERYFCPGCNHEVRLNWDDWKDPVFVHPVTRSCSPGRRLRMLGRILLKERFDDGKDFLLSFPRQVLCVNTEICPYFDFQNCTRIEPYEFNLRRFYDKCSFGNLIKKEPSMEADLIFEDSKKRYPALTVSFRTDKEIGTSEDSQNHLIVVIPIRNENDALHYAEGFIIEPIGNTSGEASPRFLGPFKKNVSGNNFSCLYGLL